MHRDYIPISIDHFKNQHYSRTYLFSTISVKIKSLQISHWFLNVLSSAVKSHIKILWHWRWFLYIVHMHRWPQLNVINPVSSVSFIMGMRANTWRSAQLHTPKASPSREKTNFKSQKSTFKDYKTTPVSFYQHKKCPLDIFTTQVFPCNMSNSLIVLRSTFRTSELQSLKRLPKAGVYFYSCQN